VPATPILTVDALSALAGRRVTIVGHFVGDVTLEDVEDLGNAALLRVRLETGRLEETTLSLDELADGAVLAADEGARLVPGEHLFDLVEATRIEHAYAHDPNFAVSMSGVRGLPHQIIAVYQHMLPQPRLRFVLADDPGAGKTIMAGLLIKELRLRMVADRILILCPAPLTVQWREEMQDKFDESFAIVDSHEVRWKLGRSPWQEHDRCVASLDFAKRDEIMPELLRADWDLVVIDEAHKCSAALRPESEDGRDRLDRTARYRLAEELSRRCERLLLMTATPHSGDPGRFHNFLRLLDPDQFAIDELAAQQIGAEDSPYFLRREKESLKDEFGEDLFVPRDVLTQEFTLSAKELALYEAVTAYIQDFLGAAAGRRGNAVALARTVLQRRLASSLGAIRSSLRRRADRINERVAELEALPPAERARRLRELLQATPLDVEQDEDDATEEEEQQVVEGVFVAESLDQMRAEIAALERLVVQTDQTVTAGEEAKLSALRDCLAKSELGELTEDGRGKLLIFTEHRDTLDYLERHLRAWGYSTCSIHGGMPPTERKHVQQLFHQERQICIATEAAGEGINLQFCHLMINYDLPWNPVRLEQRMGRIHRIGQTKRCVIFNFCATNTVEGRLLHTLFEKLETMSKALGGRVYDVIGQVLAQGGLDFERLLREALLNPAQVEAGERDIEALDPDVLKHYEEAVGIAQATKHVDISWVTQRDWRSEERRLMPEFVERLFLRAADHASLRLEERRDHAHVFRAEHVPRGLRDDRLASVKRLGPPQDAYRKLTFRKEIPREAANEDAVLLSPGHPLFAATIEVMRERLRFSAGGVAPFVAPWASDPYAIHFFTYEINGTDLRGRQELAWAELVAVIDGDDGPTLVSPDVLHDLTPSDFAPDGLEQPDPEAIRRATNHVRGVVQLERRKVVSEERLQQAQLRSDYLRQAMDAQRDALQQRWTLLEERVYRGEESARLARDEAERRLHELERRHEDKLRAFEGLGVVRPGPVSYVGTALVGPPVGTDAEVTQPMRESKEVELAAMERAMQHEIDEGREVENVSEYRDGRGFDLRSWRVPPDGRVTDVRRIEVKGRAAASGDVSLCRTEWIAANRHRDSFWLYVVYGATSDNQRLIRVQDPAATLSGVQEKRSVTTYLVPGASIEAIA
jgi:superfamily II DNA or RNA helicase